VNREEHLTEMIRIGQEILKDEVCENCLTPAIYTLEGELGKICKCTMMALTEGEE
jgi:hypothetical protein